MIMEMSRRKMLAGVASGAAALAVGVPSFTESAAAVRWRMDYMSEFLRYVEIAKPTREAWIATWAWVGRDADIALRCAAICDHDGDGLNTNPVFEARGAVKMFRDLKFGDDSERPFTFRREAVALRGLS